MTRTTGMTWDAPRRRDAVLHDVMAVADTRQDGRLPWTEVAGTEDAFGTAEDLLGALQMRWHTRLSGAIERELTEQPWDLPQAVVHAWRSLCAEMPGVRAILDAHADDEHMRRARRKEWVLLATASGLAAMDDPAAVRIGQDVEQRARAVTVVKTRPARRPSGGWFSRLRHVLAA
jgi:hypothetical protein